MSYETTASLNTLLFAHRAFSEKYNGVSEFSDPELRTRTRFKPRITSVKLSHPVESETPCGETYAFVTKDGDDILWSEKVTLGDVVLYFRYIHTLPILVQAYKVVDSGIIDALHDGHYLRCLRDNDDVKGVYSISLEFDRECQEYSTDISVSSN